MNPISLRRDKEMVADVATILHFLSYDAHTGAITWKRNKGRAKIGSEAGGITQKGYRNLEISGRKYQAHRVAWLLMTGYWPTFDIDHVDGNTLNNAFSNLREASRSENCANRRGRSGTRSGAKGAYWHKANQKWVASVGRKYIGSFSTIEEASEAYRRAAEKLHGEFARLY